MQGLDLDAASTSSTHLRTIHLTLP